MYQFFTEPTQIDMENKQVRITGKDVNHIKNVLRVRAGEEIAVSNGIDGKEYRCQVKELGKEEILCTLLFVKEDGVELSGKIYLFQGLPKGDKMELIIQKAVELGVYEIIPVSAGRSVVKLDEKREKNKLTHWQGICEAAAKQSKRKIIPEIKKVMSVKEAFAYAKDMDVKLIPYEFAEGMEKTKKLIGEIKEGQRIAVFIGPEGGFEENEIALAKEAGFTPVTMGKRILRTETAGFTILSWIMYHLEK